MAVGDGKAQTVEWHNDKLLIWNVPSIEHSFKKHPIMKLWVLMFHASFISTIYVPFWLWVWMKSSQGGFWLNVVKWTYWQGEINRLLTSPVLKIVIFCFAFFEIYLLYLGVKSVKYLQDPRSTEFDLKQRNMTVTTKNLWGHIQTRVFSFDQIELLEVKQHPETLEKYLQVTVLRKKKLEEIFLVGEDSLDVLNAWAEWLRPHLGDRVITWQAT